LLLADLESLEKRIPNLEKRARGSDKEAKESLEVIQKVLPLLQEGKPAKIAKIDAAEKSTFEQLQLLTSKPILYVCNVSEQEAATGNDFTEKVIAYAKSRGDSAVIISAAIEAEVSSLNDPAEQQEFLQALGLKETGLRQVIKAGYGLLDLLTFFTIGPKEARAWTVHQGAKAPQAAGAIHTDFERGFICAETIAYKDYIDAQGEQGAKNSGKLRQEGRDYLVSDGDIFHFRFNV